MPKINNAMNVVIGRQMDIFTKHLQKAMDDAIAEIDGTPAINALAGAIVMLESAMLAPINDKKLRKHIVRQMAQQRPIALAAARRRGNPNLEIIDLDQERTIQ